jgi:hypothetical protein
MGFIPQLQRAGLGRTFSGVSLSLMAEQSLQLVSSRSPGCTGSVFLDWFPADRYGKVLGLVGVLVGPKLTRFPDVGEAHEKRGFNDRGSESAIPRRIRGASYP